jgi:hypothetical protein
VLLLILALSEGKLQAQYYPLALNATLTVRFQESSSDRNGVSSYKTTVARLETKDLLKLLGAATSTNLDGARLVLAGRTSTNFEVLRGTNILMDVSRFFSINDSTNVLADGSANSGTGVYRLENCFMRTVSFNDGAGTSFGFSGMAQDDFHGGSSGSHGQQNFGETVTLTGAGPGQYNAKFAIFSGSLTLAGQASY